MIRVTVYEHKKVPYGIALQGHAGAGSEGNDIVCAAVSSAVYMAVNTVTDVIGVPTEIEVRDGYLKMVVSTEVQAQCETILRGLVLHLTALAEQYPKNIHMKTCEEPVAR